MNIDVLKPGYIEFGVVCIACSSQSFSKDRTDSRLQQSVKVDCSNVMFDK